jgi:hypothetical protein
MEPVQRVRVLDVKLRQKRRMRSGKRVNVPANIINPMERGLYCRARPISPRARAIHARVMPHPGHSKSVMVWNGHGNKAILSGEMPKRSEASPAPKTATRKTRANRTSDPVPEV